MIREERKTGLEMLAMARIDLADIEAVAFQGEPLRTAAEAAPLLAQRTFLLRPGPSWDDWDGRDPEHLFIAWTADAIFWVGVEDGLCHPRRIDRHPRAWS